MKCKLIFFNFSLKLKKTYLFTFFKEIRLNLSDLLFNQKRMRERKRERESERGRRRRE
jgi:hypothetical protein